MKDKITSIILDKINLERSVTVGSEWYLFGSINRHSTSPQDVDVIVICIDDAQADAIRKLVRTLTLPLPVDLSLMTFDEAAELDVIRLQCADRIY